MIQPIEFFVAGIPKGQPRPKAVRRGAHAGVYDPGTANEWKHQVHIFGSPSVPAAPLEGPLRVDLTFFFPRPKGHFKGKSTQQIKASAPRLHTSKPDIDNAAKAVFDQMTLMRFWKDDAQICDGRFRKCYASYDWPDASARSGCAVRITEAQQ